MSQNNELLHTVEHHSPEVNFVSHTEGTLTATSIEQLSLTQARMLLMLEHDISLSLFTTLYEKMEKETKLLTQILTARGKALHKKEKDNRTLDSRYFVQKQLEETII